MASNPVKKYYLESKLILKQTYVANVAEAISQENIANKLTTIVVVSYNSRHYLEKCLASLLVTVGHDCEVVVVDNASADGSADFVAAHFPGVRLIRNAANVGFAAANNQAAKAANGRYIVAINPDTAVRAGWLEALLAPLEADATIGLTTPRILMLNTPERINTCGNAMHYTGITICRGLNRAADDPALQQSGAVAAVSGACFAIRRELWQMLGGFDETFFTYLEDTDLSLRARLAGYKCWYVAEAVIYHDYGNRFAAPKIYYLERNRWLMLLKSLRSTTLLRLLPALLLTELVTWAYALKSGWPSIQARWQAYGWLIKNWREVRQQRRTTQALRCVSDKALLQIMDWRLDIEQLAGVDLARLADYSLNPLYQLNYLCSLKALEF